MPNKEEVTLRRIMKDGVWEVTIEPNEGTTSKMGTKQGEDKLMVRAGKAAC